VRAGAACEPIAGEQWRFRERGPAGRIAIPAATVRALDHPCLVVGAGDATGGAIAKRFAREGLETCIVRRARHLDSLQKLAEEIAADGGSAHAFGVDARDEEETVETLIPS